ncbi:MAG: 4-alpha-glucanotransferase [Nitrospirae bacterium]|nr:4-alpha-glucanotransferase [Nitrospirota bacterium]
MKEERVKARAKEFKKYLKEEGEAVQSFAAYMALADYFKGYSWQGWPAKYHKYSSDAVREFRRSHEKEILFYMYLQFVINGQLRQIVKLCDDNKMGIGLYHDLAIGSVGGGSDVWEYRDCMAEGADVGAPPDDFNINGQNWGFPPLIPEKLKESGYEFFIQILRKNMKYMRALRIDNVLGMFRLYWIPKGMPASDGAYVQYPYQDLLRIIALESVRNKTMIIGEDLGTVGENVREELRKFNMLSYKVFYFERNYPEPSFTLPEDYPEMALCTVTTHDLPTIYGWWAGRDIEVKKDLSIYPDDEAYQKDIINRERDKKLLLNALREQGILDPSALSIEPSEMTPEICLAVYKYLSMTPCKMLQVNLDDILGAINQQNMPGTVDEHPNWRQKTQIAIEEMITDKRFIDLSETLK